MIHSLRRSSVARREVRHVHVQWQDNVAHSRFPSIQLPPYDHCFTTFMTKDFALFDDKLAILDGITDNRRTFADLLQDINSVAYGYKSLGVGLGDTVSIMTPNHVDFFSAFHGAATLGAKVTPINPTYTKFEVARQFDNSGVKLAVVHDDCFDVVADAIAMLSKEKGTSPSDIPVLRLSDVPNANDSDSFESIRTVTSPPMTRADFPSSTIVALPYSSGTTGVPKGTMLSHDNMIANVSQHQHVEIEHYEESDVIISPLPLFHIYAFTCSLHVPLISGNPLITMKRFDLAKFCELTEKHRATHAHVVPPIVLDVAKSPITTNYDMSSIKVAMSAAAPLRADQEQEFAARVGGCIVKQAWGMSELSPIGTYMKDDHVKPGSAGLPVSNTSVKVVDLETGEALPPGSEGELCIKGPQVMQGYLGAEEKTKECLDEEGWLRTGDIALIDEEGYVFITDRIKDLIKYKGYQVAPAELESILCTHDLVADATVIAVDHEEAGQVPRAYVVKATGENDDQLTESDLQAWMGERVAPHKKLRGGIRFIEKVPKTASGKILRREVVEMDKTWEE